LIPEIVERENAGDNSTTDPKRTPFDDVNREQSERAVSNTAHRGTYSLPDEATDSGKTLETPRELVTERPGVNRKVQLNVITNESGIND
jgi:hypothetical protein